MFNFVIDVNAKAAKGKPFKMTFDELSEDIDTEYSDGIGSGEPPNIHERLTGAVIPYIDFEGSRVKGIDTFFKTFGTLQKDVYQINMQNSKLAKWLLEIKKQMTT